VDDDEQEGAATKLETRRRPVDQRASVRDKRAQGVAPELHPKLDVAPYTLAEAQTVIMDAAATSASYVEAMDRLRVHRGLTTNQPIEFIVRTPASAFFDVFSGRRPA
jgi:hypothetical protein